VAAMRRLKFRLRQCAASNSACGNAPPQIPPAAMCRLKLRLWNCLSYPQDSKTAGGNVALQICLSEWRRIA